MRRILRCLPVLALIVGCSSQGDDQHVTYEYATFTAGFSEDMEFRWSWRSGDDFLYGNTTEELDELLGTRHKGFVFKPGVYLNALGNKGWRVTGHEQISKYEDRWDLMRSRTK